MKILYISTSFPEPNIGSTIYTDLAEGLFVAGHDITVAVSEQTKNKKCTEIKKERGFDVLRIATGNYYDVGFIEKGITTLKIPVLMRRGINKYLSDKIFDMILFEAPPVTNAGLVAWAKKKFNCPAYLMLKDIFPQNAVDLGIIKYNGLLFKYFQLKEKRLYKTADIIGCMSVANKNYIINHNQWLNTRKLNIFPNTKSITNAFRYDQYPMRDFYNIPKEACVFLFGGNMGRPQYIELLCRAIEECKNEENIYFIFVGRGTDRYKLEKTIKNNNINNALVIENLPRNDYEQITKECNVGLIVLDPRFTIPNYPSRILSYMEYAKPILAATDRVTDIKELIEDAQCGEWVWSGDACKFVNKIKAMAGNVELSRMGDNGRRYIEDNFRVEHSIKILEDYLKLLI
ncbi:glycosyltransferase family 4 protein [Clostridium sp. UBA5712]|uniref:glycosyltransferase family 4 protein n=1 Tax=Clostridium sp. UBA5712 TaxID=1946368 RepID=UPI0032180009